MLNSVIRWLVSNDSTAIYDPYDTGGEDHLQKIKKPVDDARICSSSFTRLSGGLLCYGVTTWQSMIKTWTLPKDENGYRHRHTIPSNE